MDKKFRISIVVLLAASTAVAFAVGPAAAAAKVTVKTVAIKSGSKARLLVTITNSARFTSRTKPRAVTVKYRTKKYGLRHVAGTASAGAAAGATSQWQSSNSSTFNGLAGKHVSVLVRTTAKTSTFSQTVTQQTSQSPGTTTPGGSPNPGPGSLFTPPGRELSGNEAFNSFSRYFLNSRFTDCPAGWPNCSVEERYVHCPNGGWQYHRYTPTSGSDINSYGTFQVTGAAQHADGSWVVEYNETAYGYTHFYHWEVGTDGSTVGSYDGSPLGIAFKWEPGPGTITSC